MLSSLPSIGTKVRFLGADTCEDSEDLQSGKGQSFISTILVSRLTTAHNGVNAGDEFVFVETEGTSQAADRRRTSAPVRRPLQLGVALEREPHAHRVELRQTIPDLVGSHTEDRKGRSAAQ
jgi:hypothetical protein